MLGEKRVVDIEATIAGGYHFNYFYYNERKDVTIGSHNSEPLLRYAYDDDGYSHVMLPYSGKEIPLAEAIRRAQADECNGVLTSTLSPLRIEPAVLYG